MVTPTAKTGRLKINKKTVTIIHQTNILITAKVFPLTRYSYQEVKKFILLLKELTPEICKPKRTISVETPS